MIGAYPLVGEYLEALTERCGSILGSNLVGVYAAGSLALDAYQSGRSDLDVAVVCATALARPDKEAIVRALRHEALACPARGLELVVYRAEVAAAGGSDPDFEVELNSGSRMDFRATYAGSDRRVQDGTFWYAIDRSILAERGLAIVGPPAAEVVRSVSEGALVELLIASLRWHLTASANTDVDGSEDQEKADDQAAAWTDDAVLNACRAWQRVRTGHWSSKVAAGRQVLADDVPGPPTGGRAAATAGRRLDRAVVRKALAARGGGRPPPGASDARLFQRQVLAGLQEFGVRDG